MDEHKPNNVTLFIKCLTVGCPCVFVLGRGARVHGVLMNTIGVALYFYFLYFTFCVTPIVFMGTLWIWALFLGVNARRHFIVKHFYLQIAPYPSELRI